MGGFDSCPPSVETRLDTNRTVWQRLNDHLLPLMSREDADVVTSYLHPYVVAERIESQRQS